MLTDEMVRLLEASCGAAFPQKRTQLRAMEISLGTLCSFGRRTISRAICAVGRQQQDWSADYKLFSRSPWDEERLFDPIMRDYLERYRDGPVCLAMDDTSIVRSGRKIASAFWQRDALSPPFHINLVYGLRFTQASLLYPHYREGDFSARAMPVRFTESPAVKKPGRRASAEEHKAYREAKKKQNLSRQGLNVIRSVRSRLDSMAAVERSLLVAVDGSLCNRTIFKEQMSRIDLVGRCRKDARLCFPAPAGSRRKYALERFTPEQVRQDEKVPWQQAKIYFGSMWRMIRYKHIPGVLWRRGSGIRRLSLFVIAPQPYRVSPNARKYYRDPAYLLATDTGADPTVLIQCYFDRWQIEVNHREEKDTLGVGQAQVWAEKSVPRQPAFAVACYSILMLAGLMAFGPGRTDHYVPLPKWRKHAKRASALDLITLLRKEIHETSVSNNIINGMTENLMNYPYT